VTLRPTGGGDKNFVCAFKSYSHMTSVFVLAGRDSSRVSRNGPFLYDLIVDYACKILLSVSEKAGF